jgi:Subtilase family
VRHPDRVQHAAHLADAVREIRLRHTRRASVLGIDPDQVVVFELAAPVAESAFTGRDLVVLEATRTSAMVAFATDPDLGCFLADLQRFAGAPEGSTPPLQGLFDAITRVRPLRPEDVIDPDLRSLPPDVVRVDVECWCPDDGHDARRRFDEMREVIVGHGTVVDASCRPESGFSVIRADVSGATVRELADTTRVRRISRLPRPAITRMHIRRATLDDLPHVRGPSVGAPLLAVIDSGVRRDHPLLGGAVVEACALGDLDPGSDGDGHGTAVAGLALLGPLESLLATRAPADVVARLLSIRVLDDQALFPEDRLWQNDLAEALDVAAARGARVVNLSLGDDLHPYRPPGPVPVAAIVDHAAREHDMVVVVSSGNVGATSLPADPRIVDGYPAWLLNEHDDLEPLADSGLAAPAMAALALTVGSTVTDSARGTRPPRAIVDHQVLGRPGGPSPFSRTGPGIENAVKPELTAPAGTFSFDRGTGRVLATAEGSVVTAGGALPDQLLVERTGTSFAAPLVSHAALRVLGRYPALSSNAVRALVLASALEGPDILDGDRRRDVAAAERRLAGFGAVDRERAVASSDHRAVLLAEGIVPIDGVQFYAVPVPRAFFHPGRTIIRVALAHDPPVRATRAAYLGNRMSAFLYRGVPLAQVRRQYADMRETGDTEEPPFANRCKVDLQPADRPRCLGANQLSVCRYERAWTSDYDTDMVLAVRCTSRWPNADTGQRYAVAVVLETEESKIALYDELRVRLRTVVEASAELDLRT